MAELSKDLALRTKRVVEAVEQNRGATARIELPQSQLRQRRFYKLTEGAMPAPTDDLTPSSVDCTLLKFDGTDLIETQTIETVYSNVAFDADSIITASQVGGYTFAESGGGSPGSSIVLAQAQAGGIPKRSTGGLGVGTARLLVEVPSSTNTSVPLELTTDIQVYNPSLKIAGEHGDRLIWLSDNKDGALVIGWDNPNENDPSIFPQQQPQTS